MSIKKILDKTIFSEEDLKKIILLDINEDLLAKIKVNLNLNNIILNKDGNINLEKKESMYDINLLIYMLSFILVIDQDEPMPVSFYLNNERDFITIVNNDGIGDILEINIDGKITELNKTITINIQSFFNEINDNSDWSTKSILKLINRLSRDFVEKNILIVEVNGNKIYKGKRDFFYITEENSRIKIEKKIFEKD